MEQVELKEVRDYTGVVRVEHRYSPEDDRWVYMEFDKAGGLIGLNYCQGDAYDYFKECWAFDDPSLTKFYIDISSSLMGKLIEMSEFELINLILWLSWDARNYMENIRINDKK